MLNSRHRLRVPLVLLWALAHGMWIGAGMHAESQLGFGHGSAGAMHGCACMWHRLPKTQAPQLTHTPGIDHVCAVCQLGILAPEVPAAIHVVTVTPSVPVRGFAQEFQESDRTPAYLPPSRAPPALARA